VIVDSHAHVFPEVMSRLMPQRLRTGTREWLKPFVNSMHRLQPFVRVIPEPARRHVERLSSLAPLPSLLVESGPKDLKAAMQSAGIDRAVVISHPPLIDNDFVLEVCQEHPEMVAAVNISRGVSRPGITLARYARKGARALKIHASADGDPLGSPRYTALLKEADKQGLYKNPELSEARNFIPWFRKYPKLRFVLAHMNFHDPQAALDLAESYANVFVDTSWQPTETIGEAVRRLGADRILFGSDWPLVGNNLAVGLKRIQTCLETGLLSQVDVDLIQGENARRLFALS
jgi:predicted TIM-barrel fold metal-dependent hydrolase